MADPALSKVTKCRGKKVTGERYSRVSFLLDRGEIKAALNDCVAPIYFNCTLIFRFCKFSAEEIKLPSLIHNKLFDSGQRLLWSALSTP